jgi:hypothetical protein
LDGCHQPTGLRPVGDASIGDAKAIGKSDSHHWSVEICSVATGVSAGADTRSDAGNVGFLI